MVRSKWGLLHSRVVDIHYGAWLERRRWTTIASDPDRLPEYILASYLSETVDIAQLARDIPLIGSIVPDKKWVLLPARTIAMARLCIDCREQHALIRKTCEEHQKEMKVFEEKPGLVACVEKEVKWAAEPFDFQREVLASSDPLPLKVVQCAFWDAIFVLAAVQVPFKASYEYGKNHFEASSAKAKHLNWLISAYHELAMRYVHLYKTAQGDEYAVKDALLRMPEHLEVLHSEGVPVIKKLIEYCQQHWIGVPGLELLSTDRCTKALSAWKDGAKRLAPIANSEAATTIPRKQLEATSKPMPDEAEDSPTAPASEVKGRNVESPSLEDKTQDVMPIPRARSWLLRHSALFATVGATMMATVITRWRVVQTWRIASSLRR